MTKKRIAVLFHKFQKGRKIHYHLHLYADIWRLDGYEVIFLFGIAEFIPADIILVHVDRSVVSDEYLEFADRYPIRLNAEVKDIRKSSFSNSLVHLKDGYDGQVIVKSNYNFAGIAERFAGMPMERKENAAFMFHGPNDYKIFEHASEVPLTVFDDPSLVVEKFQPEYEDGLYAMRAMQFVGSRITCTRFIGPNPIVNSSTKLRSEHVAPHEEIVAMRAKLNFDYGKFDYVMHEGKPILLDINKTVGAPVPPITQVVHDGTNHRYSGIYDYFERSVEEVRMNADIFKSLS